jgi:tetratricopeptide (TPR) repeat protein
MLQHAVLAVLTKSLGPMAALLESAVAVERPASDRLSLYALACAQTGENEVAARCADELAERRPLLPATGAAWGMVAMATAELAWNLRHAALAEVVWNELRAWSGWGLTMNGVAYFGAADLWLGACAATIGRRDLAERLLEAGVRQDVQRGAKAWADHGDMLLARLCGD